MAALDPRTLRQTCQVTRTITADGLGGLEVHTPDEVVQFRGQVTASRSNSVPATDGSPRGLQPGTLWWLAQDSGLDTPVLEPGWRLNVDGTPHELVSLAREMRIGPTVWAYQADVKPVASLYPLAASLEDLGDIPVGVELPVAIWKSTGVDRVTGRGAFEELLGEAPPEFAEALEGENRQLRVGTGPTSKVFKIYGTALNTKARFVQLNFSRQDGGW